MCGHDSACPQLDNDENVYFGALDAVVRRNAYGRQLGSFAATADFGALPTMRMLWWLRRGSCSSAISAAAGDEGASEASDTCGSRISLWCSFADRSLPRLAAATVETSVDSNVVGLRQGKILATAFHPELTDDTRIHELFLSL